MKNFRITCIFSLITTFTTPRTSLSDETALEHGIKLSCEGDFDEAAKFFSSIQRERLNDHTAALHSLGNIAAIKGDLLHSGVLHGLAKESNPEVMPPLALIRLEEKPCNSMGEIFWTSSFIKKNVYDLFHGGQQQKVHYTKMDFQFNSTGYGEVSFSTDESDMLYDAHVSLATQLEISGFVDYARLHFTKAAELRPNEIELKLRNKISVPVVFKSLEHVEETRKDLETGVDRMLSLAQSRNYSIKLNHISMPGTYYIVYGGYNDKKIMKDIASTYELLYPDLNQVMISSDEGNDDTHKPSNNVAKKKIRVGFASHYFRRHSVCKLICGIIHGLDREKFHVTIFSSAELEDEWTEYVAERSDNFIRLPEGFLLKNRDVTMNLDILVFPDIGMNTGASMWAHSRLAKTQLCFWGHPVTTGLPHMDYFISSDLFEDHHADKRYSEQLVRMDSLSFFFKFPFYVEESIVKKGPFDLTTFGIPANSTVVLCPQTLPKFHPSFDSVLHELLRYDSRVFILIVFDKEKPMWKQILMDRFRTISEHHRRLIFVPTQSSVDFFRIIHTSAFLLDPFPFGGGVTTLEALAACKAVVTLPTHQSVPHLTAGMVQKMDMGEVLSSKSIVEYLNKAKKMLGSKYRAKVEEEICQQRTLLYDQVDAVREWETLLESVSRG